MVGFRVPTYSSRGLASPARSMATHLGLQVVSSQLSGVTARRFGFSSSFSVFFIKSYDSVAHTPIFNVWTSNAMGASPWELLGQVTVSHTVSGYYF